MWTVRGRGSRKNNLSLRLAIKSSGKNEARFGRSLFLELKIGLEAAVSINASFKANASIFRGLCSIRWLIFSISSR